MEEFKLSKFTKQGEELLDDVRCEFKSLNMDDSILPKVFSDDDDKIKLVFVGQYSAGKQLHIPGTVLKLSTHRAFTLNSDLTTMN